MNLISFENILYDKKGTWLQQTLIVLRLSFPAILAQLTSIAMQYIDAGMVGRLGADATAAIGLVAPCTWLIGGICIGLAAGFSVQVAQLTGAGETGKARNVFRQSLITLLLAGLLIGMFGVCISRSLPVWLGGSVKIREKAAVYFLIYSCSILFSMMRYLSGSMMQSSGDMKTPGFFSGLVCLLDVVFNFFFIFPSRDAVWGNFRLWIPGAGLGVKGAAIGTALSEIVISFVMLYMACFKNSKLDLRCRGSWRLRKKTLINAAKIAIPISFDQFFMCSAYIMATKIIAGIGTVAVAANSLAITAESLCYMPGYGIGVAATTIIGQTIGAGRDDLTRSFSRVILFLGMGFMGLMGVIMYRLAPIAFLLLTSDPRVAALGTGVLRMELIAEPFYGASICCSGIFRGAGDTLVPSIMNLCSMWGLRILLAVFLVPRMGLYGYWLAMTIELFFRGSIFMVRLAKKSHWF